MQFVALHLAASESLYVHVTSRAQECKNQMCKHWTTHALVSHYQYSKTFTKHRYNVRYWLNGNPQKTEPYQPLTVSDIIARKDLYTRHINVQCSHSTSYMSEINATIRQTTYSNIRQLTMSRTTVNVKYDTRWKFTWGCSNTNGMAATAAAASLGLYGQSFPYPPALTSSCCSRH